MKYLQKGQNLIQLDRSIKIDRVHRIILYFNCKIPLVIQEVLDIENCADIEESWPYYFQYFSELNCIQFSSVAKKRFKLEIIASTLSNL